MPVLTSEQRKTLEDGCTKGRRASEQAARAALTSLALTAERPPAHLNEGERQLRRGLRAKARQLGDTGTSLDLLVAECAYEQWHRLLFARFLAENNLLIHPEYHAPVSLEDCEELAESLGEPDGWSVAARFAAEILPGIFRLDDPCVRLRLAPEGRLALEAIVASLPADVFAAADSLGWVYQYWQKDKKDEVNASERKIGGADLGPVTQLFTENYMVRFLLENTLGAWWAARHPNSTLVKNFEYLRLDEAGEPVAGRFEGWPDRVAEVTVMDPCCGSGHFLVEAFSMLWRMRAEEERLSPVDAQDAALRENLFGLELDPRCVQIAMFAVALRAWKEGGGWRQLPVPHVACSGIPVKAPVDEWRALANGDPGVESALVRLHILFGDAETLGSLIDPKQATELADPTGLQRSFEDVPWEAVVPSLDAALAREQLDPAVAVLGLEASSLARAAALLAHRYVLIATNVPYVSQTRFSPILRDYVQRFHAPAKADLGTVFLSRFRGLTIDGGTYASVSLMNWLFLSSFRTFREGLLRGQRIRLLSPLGPGAFGSISGEVVKVVLSIIDNCSPRASAQILGTSAAGLKADPIAKAVRLREGPLLSSTPKAQLLNPDSRITLESLGSGPLLSEFAESSQGICTGDYPRFGRYFWEVSVQPSGPWEYQQSTPTAEGGVWSGCQNVLYWQAGKGELFRYISDRLGPGRESAWIRGIDFRRRSGVAITQAGSLRAGLFSGELFDNNTVVLVPKRAEDGPALARFVLSESFRTSVRLIDSNVRVADKTMLKVPFDIEYWRNAAEEEGALPTASSDDPAQWLFNGRLDTSSAPLQVAVARLCGYRWPEQDGVDDLDAFADSDGIVCLPSVAGEPPAADRLQQLLGTAFGSSWTPTKQKEVLEATGSKKKNLADWLRDDFFKQHCAYFGQRPFIWHIWDGQRDGFAALVNYHRLDRKTLEKLTFTYLGDWIERQRAEARDEKSGADARLAAASKLRSSLELILEGEPPYDIFVRWKSLAEQPNGWEPDINDGVRVNVRPFVEAGVLRSSFNIHWRKDRGKNPDGSERLNDLHFTTSEKRAARSGS